MSVRSTSTTALGIMIMSARRLNLVIIDSCYTTPLWTYFGLWESHSGRLKLAAGAKTPTLSHTDYNRGFENVI